MSVSSRGGVALVDLNSVIRWGLVTSWMPNVQADMGWGVPTPAAESQSG